MLPFVLKRWWLFGVLAGVASCGSPTEPMTPTTTTPPATDAGTAQDPAAIARGEALFQTHCAVCHPGGNAGVGPSLKTSTATPNQMRSQVRNGVGLMPPFPSSVISDAQLNDLIAYVMSLRAPQ